MPIVNAIAVWGDSMVQGVLVWLLRGSGEAAVIALLVLAVQLMFGRWLTAAWRYRLWGLVVLRLMLPVAPASALSLWNVSSLDDVIGQALRRAAESDRTAAGPTAVNRPAGSAVEANQKTVVRYRFELVDAAGSEKSRHQPPPAAAAEDVPAASPAAAAPPPDASVSSPVIVVLLTVWLLGALLLIGRLIIANILFNRRLRRATLVANDAVLRLLAECARKLHVTAPPLLICDAIRSPATARVWRSCLLLPAGLLESLSPAELRAVFLHELAHVRCRDVAMNWLLAILQAIHWFNPIIWFAFARLRSDREICRDAMVLKITAADDTDDATATANAYGRTLLMLAERVSSAVAGRGGALACLAAPSATAGMIGDGSGPLASTLFSRRPDLHRRLRMIARFRRAADRRFVLVGPALFLALGCGALTGPRAKSPAATQPVAAASVRSIAELEAQARALTKDQRYAEAVEVVKQILQRDPHNDYAIGVRPLLEDRVVSMQQRRYQDAEEQKRNEQSAQDEERLRQKLDRKLPELNLQNRTLEEAIALLRDASGADIFVNWNALAEAGIERTKPVTVRLFNVKVSKALAIVLDGASGPTRKSRLGYTVDEGVITISTAEDLSKNVLTRVYDVRDLLILVPEGKEASLWSREHPATEPARPAPPATQPDGGQVSAPASQPTANARQAQIDALITLIKETVAPDSWTPEDHVGAIKELSGQLVITQTPENQKSIQALLEQLREQRSLQVMIEATFLSCDEEKISALLKRWRTTGATRPANAPASTPGSGTLFLTDDQDKQLLQAAQAGDGMSIIASPRVVLVNGQQASVRIGGEVPYKQDYRLVKDAAGKPRYEPTIAYAETGWLFDATATASADRKSITLKLRPQISVLEGMIDLPWPDRPAGSDLMIQTPRLKISEIRTAINVPEGGTVLLGGLVDPGLPAPGTDAATQPATRPAAQAPRRLFLLVKPRLIIQVGQDKQREFPLLNTRK